MKDAEMDQFSFIRSGEEQEELNLNSKKKYRQEQGQQSRGEKKAIEFVKNEHSVVKVKRQGKNFTKRVHLHYISYLQPTYLLLLTHILQFLCIFSSIFSLCFFLNWNLILCFCLKSIPLGSLQAILFFFFLNSLVQNFQHTQNKDSIISSVHHAASTIINILPIF